MCEKNDYLEPGAGLRRSGVSLWTVDNANLRWIRAPCFDPIDAKISSALIIPSDAKILARRALGKTTALSASISTIIGRRSCSSNA